MLNALIEAPRWLFLALLIYAPWAYGCTVPWAVQGLDLGMAVVLVLWVDACLLRKMRPAVHPTSIGCVVFLLVQGWWMASNGHYMHDPVAHAFTKVAAPVGWAPGTVDRAVSTATMLRLTGLLGMVLFTGDLALRPVWRRRLCWTIGLAGVSVVLLGLMQRVSGAPMIFWEDPPTRSSFFATYYYSGNAGSFINLVLPPVAGLAVLAMRDPNAHVPRAIWIPGLLLCIAGAFVNTSRVAQLIACGLTLVFAGTQTRPLARAVALPRGAVLAVYAAIGVAALAGLILFAGLERSSTKWGLLQSQLNSGNPRWLAFHASWKMLSDAGWVGLGPGTFGIAFPHYTGFLGTAIAGTWRYAHQDYLQTVIEWGFVGAAVWGVLFFGGLVRCFTGWWKGSPMPRPDAVRNASAAVAPGPRMKTADRLLLFCAGLSLTGVAIHALVDFPLQIASLQLYVAVFLGMGWTSSGSRAGAAALP